MRRLALFLPLALSACVLPGMEKPALETTAVTLARFEAERPEGYPDDITPLEPPLRVDLAYRPFAQRPYLRRIVWRPAPGEGEGPRLRLEATGSIAAIAVPGGVAVTLRREPTRLIVDDNESRYRDKGLLRAAITAVGRIGETDLEFPALKSALEHRYAEDMGKALRRDNRVPPYRPLSRRSGPADSVADRIEADERRARRAVVRALEPLTGILLGLPKGAVAKGDAVPLLSRNLGLLFRGRHDIPVSVGGVVAGLAKHGGRRVLVVDAAGVVTSSEHRVEARGYGLLDLESGIYLLTDVTMRLIVGKAPNARAFLVRDTSRIEAK